MKTSNFRIFTILASGETKELGTAKSLYTARKIGREWVYKDIFIENLADKDAKIIHYRPKENQ